MTMLFLDTSCYQRYGHPLSRSIWKDAVCDCEPQLYGQCLLGGGIVYGSREAVAQAAADHNLDHDFSEPSDTDRPPAPSVEGRTCYFCGDPGEHIVHLDMPACDSCKRRAVGRRSK